MDLVLPPGNSGLGSLAIVHNGSGRSFKVRTTAGHSYLERLDPNKPTVIKIDVEGHEVKALKGIEEVLAWPDVAIVAEVIDVMLRRAGDSADALSSSSRRTDFGPSYSNYGLPASGATSGSPRQDLSRT